jgi:transcriptional regulator with XRE-family HTH domain
LSVVQLSTKKDLYDMENLKVKIGQRIKEMRIKKGLSQEKLALLSDLDRTYIPSIENGKRNISITVLEKLSNALDISVSELTKGL